MTYDESDRAEFDEALAEMAPIDRKVDQLVMPMIEAMLRMRMGQDAEPPVWELKAEGAHVGESVKEVMLAMEEQELLNVLFCALGRLAALSVRYAVLIGERGVE